MGESKLHALSRTIRSPKISRPHRSMLTQWRPSLSASSRTLSACATLTPARAPRRWRRHRMRDAPALPASRATRGCAHCRCGLDRRKQLREAGNDEDNAKAPPAGLGARRRRRTCGAAYGRVGQGQAGRAAAGGSARPSAAADTLRVRDHSTHGTHLHTCSTEGRSYLR